MFDIIEYYSYQKQDESFIKFINTIFDNSDLPFILEGFRISESNSFSIEDSTDKAKINDEDLKRIIESAKELFSKHEMELACEKIWDAFERVKTYYYPDISDKKGSVEKVCGSTVKLQLILDILSAVEAGGIRGERCDDAYYGRYRTDQAAEGKQEFLAVAYHPAHRQEQG